MNYINQLFNQTSFDPLNFIGIILTIIASIYIFKSETSISFTKERHDRLIFPLFNLLEPYLYQKPPANLITEALRIIEENRNLADGKLLEICYYYSKKPSSENYVSLCSYIDNAYDRSCRRLGLKTRSLIYRFNRSQYKNKLFLVIFFTVYSIFVFLSIVLSLFAILCICNMFYLLFKSANTNQQIISLLFGSVLLLAFVKYIYKTL